MTRNTNDNMLTIYLSSIIRAIIALHELMNNKIQNAAWENAKSIEVEKENEKTEEKKEKKELPSSPKKKQ